MSSQINIFKKIKKSFGSRNHFGSPDIQKFKVNNFKPESNNPTANFKRCNSMDGLTTEKPANVISFKNYFLMKEDKIIIDIAVKLNQCPNFLMIMSIWEYFSSSFNYVAKISENINDFENFVKGNIKFYCVFIPNYISEILGIDIETKHVILKYFKIEYWSKIISFMYLFYFDQEMKIK